MILNERKALSTIILAGLGYLYTVMQTDDPMGYSISIAFTAVVLLLAMNHLEAINRRARVAMFQAEHQIQEDRPDVQGAPQPNV